MHLACECLNGTILFSYKTNHHTMKFDQGLFNWVGMYACIHSLMHREVFIIRKVGYFTLTTLGCVIP